MMDISLRKFERDSNFGTSFEKAQKSWFCADVEKGT
jgi:hypothetical protein